MATANKVPLPAVGDEMPASIGLCADEYSNVRQLRLAMEKIVANVKARESEIREYIINNLSKSDDSGAAGKKYRAQIVVKPTPRLSDWTAFTAFVAENDRFDLMHKRLADSAIKDMWEAGAEVPGVDSFNVVDVSITKI